MWISRQGRGEPPGERTRAQVAKAALRSNVCHAKERAAKQSTGVCYRLGLCAATAVVYIASEIFQTRVGGLMLWKARLKGLGPVYEVLVEATEGKEREVAEAYAAGINQRVIGEVVPAVVATEAILSAAAAVVGPVVVPPAPAAVRPIQPAK
jgi:hypothetical protein